MTQTKTICLKLELTEAQIASLTRQAQADPIPGTTWRQLATRIAAAAILAQTAEPKPAANGTAPARRPEHRATHRRTSPHAQAPAALEPAAAPVRTERRPGRPTPRTLEQVRQFFTNLYTEEPNVELLGELILGYLDGRLGDKMFTKKIHELLGAT